eukprot:TRINITY_DN31578_c0_g1_i1.p1 TRINITY_DN31578_c0_g1~~TRINITY_DN31578_c0_g1_i1.p1  ORF type:complete len:442 (+),score=48.33 TRINITY_DN31578_c0_g1_i1:78-1403(+)
MDSRRAGGGAASPGAGARRKRHRLAAECAEGAAVGAVAAVAAAAATAPRPGLTEVLAPGVSVLQASRRHILDGLEEPYGDGTSCCETAVFSLRHGRGPGAYHYTIGVTPTQERLLCAFKWKVPKCPAIIHRVLLGWRVLALEGTSVPPGCDWCLLRAPSLRPLAREPALVRAVRGWLGKPFNVVLEGVSGTGLRCVVLGRPLREESGPDAACIPYEVAAWGFGGDVLCRAGIAADSPTFTVKAHQLPRSLGVPPQRSYVMPAGVRPADFESDSDPEDSIYEEVDRSIQLEVLMPRDLRVRSGPSQGLRSRQPGGSVTAAAASQEQVGDAVCIVPGRRLDTSSRRLVDPPPAPRRFGLVVAKNPGGTVDVASGGRIHRLYGIPSSRVREAQAAAAAPAELPTALEGAGSGSGDGEGAGSGGQRRRRGCRLRQRRRGAARAEP